MAEKHLSPLPSLLLVAYLAANESLGLQLTATVCSDSGPKVGPVSYCPLPLGVPPALGVMVVASCCCKSKGCPTVP